jgi:hypothetical protein
MADHDVNTQNREVKMNDTSWKPDLRKAPIHKPAFREQRAKRASQHSRPGHTPPPNTTPLDVPPLAAPVPAVPLPSTPLPFTQLPVAMQPGMAIPNPANPLFWLQYMNQAYHTPTFGSAGPTDTSHPQPVSRRHDDRSSSPIPEEADISIEEFVARYKERYRFPDYLTEVLKKMEFRPGKRTSEAVLAQTDWHGLPVLVQNRVLRANERHIQSFK